MAAKKTKGAVKMKTFVTNWEVDDLVYDPPRKSDRSPQKIMYVSPRPRLQLGFDPSSAVGLPTALWQPSPPYAKRDGQDLEEGDRMVLDLQINDEAQIAFFNAWDERNIDEIVKHSKDLFGKTMSKSFVVESQAYNPILKKRDDGKMFIRVKIPIGASAPEIKKMSINGDRIGQKRGSVDCIVSGSPMLVNLDAHSIWFMPATNRAGVSLTLKSAKILPSDGVVVSKDPVWALPDGMVIEDDTDEEL